MHVTLNEINLHYTQSGSGHPVVLLHGWGANAKAFDPVCAFLEKHFTTYALDLPGFGDTPEPPSPWGLAEYTALVHAFLAHFKLDSPILIGHSFGGRLIIKLAGGESPLGPPPPLGKIILLDSAGIKPRRTLAYQVRVRTFKTIRFCLELPGIRAFSAGLLARARAHFGSSDYRSASDIMRQAMVKAVNEDLTHLLPNITSSTLLIWGEADTATPLADAQLMEKRIPDAGLVLFKGAGHWAYLERLNEFLVVLNNFLAPEIKAAQ